jgi:hypothetical protein
MKKKPNKIKSQILNRFSKQTILIIFCFVTLVILATSCYTTKKCPAYGQYSQIVES